MEKVGRRTGRVLGIAVALAAAAALAQPGVASAEITTFDTTIGGTSTTIRVQMRLVTTARPISCEVLLLREGPYGYAYFDSATVNYLNSGSKGAFFTRVPAGTYAAQIYCADASSHSVSDFVAPIVR
jgi:hypothetical protein